jgi:hypothetical protein
MRNSHKQNNTPMDNYDCETHYDKEVIFDYEGKTYYWQGDYTVSNWGEDESDYAPAYGETEVTIDYTASLSYNDEETDEVIEVKPTRSLLMQIEIEIERNL